MTLVLIVGAYSICEQSKHKEDWPDKHSGLHD